MHNGAEIKCLCWLWLCSNLEYEIVIIDDNSPDGTQDVVKRLQTAYSSDRIVSVPPPKPHAVGSSRSSGSKTRRTGLQGVIVIFGMGLTCMHLVSRVLVH